ncbi:MAG: sigma-70 family RNA polymerase sigma factor [Planctomycetes bacterium]|nr:sigma-70 family RNA polymerase sigma factor [Planctomycetota bacterium]
MDQTSEVMRILQAMERGERLAAEQLLPAVYADLRRLAAQKLAQEPPGQTLQATALVHEAYMAVADAENDPKWDHRGHFFMAAAEAMRRILINRALQKKTLKRGGDGQRVELQEADLVISVAGDDLLDLDEALQKLAENSPQEAELVKLRYFSGLTLVEAAEVLDISRATASRYWAYARAFLKKSIAEANSS